MKSSLRSAKDFPFNLFAFSFLFSFCLFSTISTKKKHALYIIVLLYDYYL